MKRKKKMRSSRRAVVITTLAILLATQSQPLLLAAEKNPDPKQPYALIFGTVFGPDSRPASGVKIKMRREGEKKSVELVSDARGEFAHRFPAGKADYQVWADLKDKQAAEKTQVKVHVEKDERQDVTLHLTNQSSK
jgi:hypothetical protein